MKGRIALLYGAGILTDSGSNSDKGNEPKLFRRTELPIYPIEQNPPVETRSEDVENTMLLNAVQTVKKEGCKVVRKVRSITDRCSRFVTTGYAHTKYNIDTTMEYLHEDRNLLPRIGAIGIGTFVGYLFSLRRGFIKRFIYITTGATVAAAICYPSEAVVYANEGVRNSRRYLIISYHFLNGVTKDLTGFELPLYPLQLLSKDMESSSKQDGE